MANVKWLTRVEVRDTRLMNRFMARDYVTIREEPPAQEGGAPVWAETSVGRARLKSVPAKVTRLGGRHRIVGAAWGAPIAGVDVKIDDGAWVPATLDRTPSEDAPFAWTLWSLDWGVPAPGEHTVTSRTIEVAGRVQPAPDDPWIANKRRP